MNKALRSASHSTVALSAVAAAVLLFASGALAQGAKPPLPASRVPLSRPLAAGAPGKNVKTPAGEQFFIIASVDVPRSEILLKYPTEVTQMIHVNSSTRYLNDAGKAIQLADLRAGDTVWLIASGSGEKMTALRVRKGGMTVADLHRYYLDYPEIK